MSSSARRADSAHGTASLAALAVALFIATLSVACLRLVTATVAVSRKQSPPPNAITELAIFVSQIAKIQGETPEIVLPGLSAIATDSGVVSITVREHLAGLDGIDAPTTMRWQEIVPINPAIADPRRVEEVYRERTRSPERARQFTREIAQHLAGGTQLREENIKQAAGVDYPAICGVITGEPALNVNTAPASILLTLPEELAPEDEEVAGAINAMIGGLLSVRTRRVISADELASAIETAAATLAPGMADYRDQHRSRSGAVNTGRLIQQLTASVGVRGWMWDLTVEYEHWSGTAIIAHLPGHSSPLILGMSVEPRAVD